MKSVHRSLMLALLAAIAVAASAQQGGPAGNVNWPGFRGHGASGVAEGFATPSQWDVEAAAGIEWSVPIPGLGHSSPVVWGNRVFLTTAISETDNSLKPGLYGDIAPVMDDSNHEWRLYCLDRRDGSIVWQKSLLTAVPKTRRHTKSTQANPSVATDGSRVVALFGSEGLFVFDVDGELLWRKDLGVLDAGYYVVPEAQWGYSSSPILVAGNVIVQADVQAGPFLAAFSLEDGTEVWRTDRDDVPTFGTPTLYDAPGGPAVAINGYRHIGGYDARTGAELWRLTGGGDIPTPTPVIDGDTIFITNAHGGLSPIYAVSTHAMGDITPDEGESSGEHLAWSRARDGAYMATPLVYGEHLYMVRHNGILAVFSTAGPNLIDVPANLEITPSSVTLHWTSGAAAKSQTDDGVGGFAGDGNAAGSSINYTTGAITLDTTGDVPDASTTITIDYSTATDDVATNLAAAINALPGFTAASLASVITVSGPFGPTGNNVRLDAYYEGVVTNYTLNPANGYFASAEPTIGPPTILT